MDVALDAPSLPDAVTERLTERLHAARCVVEYGAGGSTVLAARIGVPTIISVESDAEFLRHVLRSVARTPTTSTLHGIHADIGPTGKWGRPVDDSRFSRWHRYSQAGFLRARKEGVTPDFVFIDGRFRVACFFVTLLCAEPGTRILIDDYAKRDKLHVIEQFAEREGLVDRAGEFVVPAALDVTGIALQLARYSVLPHV